MGSAARRLWVRLAGGLVEGAAPSVTVDGPERWRASIGAALGIFAAAVCSRQLPALLTDHLWLFAPLGASAVLVFALPASPLAQPWPVIGGNTLSALIGIACGSLIHEPASAAAAAVALSIGGMFLARCLHPPGGATALLVVLNQVGQVGFALFPVGLNSLLLVGAGILYNSLTGKPYPHRHGVVPAPGAAPRALRFSEADLDAALKHYNQVLDVSRDDLEDLLHQTELAAYRRNLGSLRCRDIMSGPPLGVARHTPLAEAHRLMGAHRVKALPVTDGRTRVVGILTAWDILERLASRRASQSIAVGAVMSTPASTARADQPVMDLVRLFSEGGRHHIPIVDDAQHLVGVITQSDLIRALYRAVRV